MFLKSLFTYNLYKKKRILFLNLFDGWLGPLKADSMWLKQIPSEYVLMRVIVPTSYEHVIQNISVILYFIQHPLVEMDNRIMEFGYIKYGTQARVFPRTLSN